MKAPSALLGLCAAALIAGCAAGEPRSDAKPASADEISPPEYSAEELVKVGRAYNARGESAKAIGVLRQALEKNPDRVEGQFQLGLALTRLEKRKEAIEVLASAHQRDAGHVGVAQLLGMAYDLERQTAKAVAVYEASLARHPDNPELLHEYGLSLLMLDKVDDGLVALVRARKGNPKDAALLGDLGYAQLLAGKVAEAQVTLQESVDRDPREPEVVFNLGRACLANKDPNAAAAAFGILVQLVPDSANARFSLCHSLGLAKKTDQARSACQQAIRIEPKHEKASHWLKGHPPKKR